MACKLDWRAKEAGVLGRVSPGTSADVSHRSTLNRLPALTVTPGSDRVTPAENVGEETAANLPVTRTTRRSLTLSRGLPLAEVLVARPPKPHCEARHLSPASRKLVKVEIEAGLNNCGNYVFLG